MFARQAIGTKIASLAILGLCALRVCGQAPATQAKPVAYVNGEPIAAADLQAMLDARPSPVPLTKEQQRQLHHAALDMLVDDVLMKQFLRRTALPAQPAEIQLEIDELKKVLEKKTMTLEQFLRENKQTEEQFRQDVNARVLWKHYLVTRFPENETRNYYEVNKVLFDKVFVQASHILIKLAPSATPLERQQAHTKLESIRHEILTGKLDFAEAARRFSDCPSKDKGGDIGSFPYKFVVVEAFSRAAFAMKKGEISDIVTTDFGLHIIKVTDRTQGETTTYQGAKDSVREIMAQDLDLYQTILAEQRKAAKIQEQLP
jgi:peptidyl-prolyl cis-trans isomerase C